MSWTSQNFTGSRMIWINVEKLPWLVGKKKKNDFVRTHWRIERMDYKWIQCRLLRISGEDIWEVATWRSGIDAKFVSHRNMGYSEFMHKNPSVIAFSYVSYLHSIRNKATGSLVTAGVNSGYLSGAILLDLLNYPRNFSAQWQFQSC